MDPNAGRELDVLVAEYIMGWDWYTVVGINVLLPPGHDFRERPVLATPGRRGAEDDVDSRRFYDSDRGGPKMPVVPAFSADLAAAFEIQAEMERRGYWALICSPLNSSDGWWCGFTRHHRPNKEARGKTVAEAICRAALKIVVT